MGRVASAEAPLDGPSLSRRAGAAHAHTRTRLPGREPGQAMPAILGDRPRLTRTGVQLEHGGYAMNRAMSVTPTPVPLSDFGGTREG